MHDEENDGDEGAPKEQEYAILPQETVRLDDVAGDDDVITDIEWIPIIRELPPIQALLLKEFLEAENIPVVSTGYTGDGFEMHRDIIRGNALLVPERVKEQAKQIVEDFLNNPPEIPDDVGEPEDPYDVDDRDSND
ncbi:hypothetical protein KDL45_04155 [bacterium]|nr:hypothetical protein [bacterium]MCB9476432.1 hypothetical protein [Deltaproteobacteria bacterium]MCB9478407.1 hypothetical protein [Deltaproteobacteria bacterium]